MRPHRNVCDVWTAQHPCGRWRASAKPPLKAVGTINFAQRSCCAMVCKSVAHRMSVVQPPLAERRGRGPEFSAGAPPEQRATTPGPPAPMDTVVCYRNSSDVKATNWADPRNSWANPLKRPSTPDARWLASTVASERTTPEPRRPLSADGVSGPRGPALMDRLKTYQAQLASGAWSPPGNAPGSPSRRRRSTRQPATLARVRKLRHARSPNPFGQPSSTYKDFNGRGSTRATLWRGTRCGPATAARSALEKCGSRLYAWSWRRTAASRSSRRSPGKYTQPTPRLDFQGDLSEGLLVVSALPESSGFARTAQMISAKSRTQSGSTTISAPAGHASPATRPGTKPRGCQRKSTPVEGPWKVYEAGWIRNGSRYGARAATSARSLWTSRERQAVRDEPLRRRGRAWAGRSTQRRRVWQARWMRLGSARAQSPGSRASSAPKSSRTGAISAVFHRRFGRVLGLSFGGEWLNSVNIQPIFRKCDENKSGHLCYDEFRKGLPFMGVPLNDKEFGLLCKGVGNDRYVYASNLHRTFQGDVSFVMNLMDFVFQMMI